MKRLLIMDLWYGDEAGPSKSALYSALGAHFDLRFATIDHPLRFKVLRYVKTFYPGLEQWKKRVCSYDENIGKYPSTFRLYTELFNRALSKIPEDYDALLQIGSLFGPVEIADDTPYFSYHDSAVKNPDMMWQKWIPGDFDKYREEWYALERNMFASTTATMTYSSYVRNTLVDHYALESNRITVVGSALKIPDEFEINWSDRGYDVLFVSTDFERKGGDRLPEIFEGITQQVPEARLVVVGHSTADFRKNRQPWLDILGPVPRSELVDIYKRSSVLLHPALYDPFPSVILEAANFEIPAVASNICGIPEMIRDGQTGYLVEKDNTRDFTDKVVSLLQDRDQLTETGRKAKEYVRGRFHPNAVAQNMSNVINVHL